MVKIRTSSAMLSVGILGTYLFLQFGCATVEKYQVEGRAVEVEGTPGEPLLLADKHKVRGIECTDCHMESPPDREVPTDICLTCHESFVEPAVNERPYNIDPHNAHYTLSNCGDCHHAHWQSQNQCLACHDFNLQAP
jgi:hypothetical protein